MKALIRKIFEKSSFHGFVYIVRRDIHFMERILWGIILFVATYFSVDICWNQWERYKENPTVFGVERVIGTREFPYMGVTLCSNYFDEKEAEKAIRDTWNVTPSDEKFVYYMKFLKILSIIKYNNMDILYFYRNDETLKNIDFLKILWAVKYTLATNNSMENKESHVHSISYGNEENHNNIGNQTHGFYSVITEVGLCLTTSFLHAYQNPLGFQKEPEKVKKPEMCTPFDVCNLKIAPNNKDGNRATAYIHNSMDIVPQDDKQVIMRTMKLNEITTVYVDLELLSAEKEVRNVPIKYRKCRFTNENNLKYFKTYRPILCRNECRIDAALKLCKCKPYFYVVGPGPICSIGGMLCLANANWTHTKCEHCFHLCSLVKYTALKATAHNYNVTRFERVLQIQLALPKMGIRRRVVFSKDQLVVAFGGAASLFLGCSFLSLAQILYYIIQFFEEKFISLFQRFKNK